MLELTDHLVGKSNQISVGRRPANKGRRYPADPPRVEEIVAVMRQAGTDTYVQRLRGYSESPGAPDEWVLSPEAIPVLGGDARASWLCMLGFGWRARVDSLSGSG